MRDASVEVPAVRMTTAHHQQQRRPRREVLFEPRCRPDRIADGDGLEALESDVADAL
jgi:hypothetical protein